MKFYDTNALLELMDKAFEDEFYLSSKSIEELENIKVSQNKDSQIKYQARKVCHLLDEYYGEYNIKIVNVEHYKVLEEFNLPVSNDNLIIAGCYLLNKIKPIEFITNDIACRVIAREIFGLESNGVNTENNEEDYTGFKVEMLSDYEMADLYQNSTVNIYNCLINQYLLIENYDGEIVDKLKWNGEKYVSLSYNPINNDFTGKIKPKNLEQELAFDMLQDNKTTIKVLAGNYGTGKDFLMISTALQLLKNNKYDKIMWVRNNIEVKNTKPIGFLPEGLSNKLLPFAMVMADHVGGESGLTMLMDEGKVEIQHLGFIRGRDIKNTIIICSESENMTKEHIQLLIGRVGEGSTLWLNGDYRQVDDKIFESNNGLTIAIEKLKGNSKFGFVKLLKTERSETSAMADLLD